MNDWRYYNHALIPTVAPDESPDISFLDDISDLKKEGKNPLFARWTSDFGNADHKDWYYVIKSEQFDITALKSNRRYEINKGKKNFTCRRIDPREYVDEIYNIQVEVYKTYPEKYRPSIDRETVGKWIQEWENVWGAFDGNGNLCSFLQSNIYEKYIELTLLKSLPSRERENVNFAILNTFLEDQAQALAEGKYICNGERNLLHETNFNEFLEKYFGFKKVFCQLNMRYFGFMKPTVRLLYPFRKLFYGSENKILSSVGSILQMEEIARKTGGHH